MATLITAHNRSGKIGRVVAQISTDEDKESEDDTEH